MANHTTSAATDSTEGPIIEVDGADRLVGSRCPACGTHEFPPQNSCARCGERMEVTPLPDAGTVWSWTVQRTRPKRLVGSGAYEPFALGYVDLGPLKVAARLDGQAPADWRIGQRVVLKTPPADSTDAPPYWFEPEATS